MDIVSHEYNSTLEIRYSRLSNINHVYDAMAEDQQEYLYPDFAGILKAMRNDQKDTDNPNFMAFLNICENLKGFHSLFTVYSNHLHDLPRRMVGPNVIAYETFLDEFEHVVGTYALSATEQKRDSSFNTTLIDPGYFNAEDRMRLDISWPKDKYIILYRSEVQESTTYLYSDYLQGLSDSLNRLGL